MSEGNDGQTIGTGDQQQQQQQQQQFKREPSTSASTSESPRSNLPPTKVRKVEATIADQTTTASSLILASAYSSSSSAPAQALAPTYEQPTTALEATIAPIAAKARLQSPSAYPADANPVSIAAETLSRLRTSGPIASAVSAASATPRSSSTASTPQMPPYGSGMTLTGSTTAAAGTVDTNASLKRTFSNMTDTAPSNAATTATAEASSVTATATAVAPGLPLQLPPPPHSSQAGLTPVISQTVPPHGTRPFRPDSSQPLAMNDQPLLVRQYQLHQQYQQQQQAHHMAAAPSSTPHVQSLPQTYPPPPPAGVPPFQSVSHQFAPAVNSSQSQQHLPPAHPQQYQQQQHHGQTLQMAPAQFAQPMQVSLPPLSVMAQNQPAQQTVLPPQQLHQHLHQQPTAHLFGPAQPHPPPQHPSSTPGNTQVLVQPTVSQSTPHLQKMQPLSAAQSPAPAQALPASAPLHVSAPATSIVDTANPAHAGVQPSATLAPAADSSSQPSDVPAPPPPPVAEPRPTIDGNGVLVGLPPPGAYARWCLASESNEFQNIGLFDQGALTKQIFDRIFNEEYKDKTKTTTGTGTNQSGSGSGSSDSTVAKTDVTSISNDSAVIQDINGNPLPPDGPLTGKNAELLGKKTRTRNITTNAQYRVLQRVFAYTLFPSSSIRAHLAEQLKMAPRTVQVWFQNQRQKIRVMRAKSTAAVGIDTSQLNVMMDDLQYEVRYAWNIQEKIGKEGLVSLGFPHTLRVDVQILALSLAAGIPAHIIRNALEGNITPACRSGAAPIVAPPPPPIPPPPTQDALAMADEVIKLRAN